MKNNKLLMPFPKPLLKVTFMHRPQRFLAEMKLSDGSKEVAYCANPGSFNGCLKAGSKALIWDSENPKRKRRYTWKAIKVGRTWIGTDTQIANGIVEKILQQNFFDCFDGYDTIKKEATIVPGTRIDFLLTGNRGECFIEVKSATIVEAGTARFPDSITPRGLKHIETLTEIALTGKRAIQVFIIQRSDAEDFAINQLCFPAYTKVFYRALEAGVEILPIAVSISPKGIGNPKILPIRT